MVKIESGCLDCAVPGYPCRGIHCPNRSVEVNCCDKCEGEFHTFDNINEVDGKEYCDDCYKELFGEDDD